MRSQSSFSIPIIASIAIIALLFIVSFFAYPSMPESMVTHWGLKGEANGSSGRIFGLFFVPVLSIFLFLLLVFLPRFDPLHKNVEGFQKTYHYVILAIMVFFLLIHGLIIAANMGFVFPMTALVFAFVGLLFIVLGFQMPKLKRNWFIGIRTPWTISDDKVWEKTHVLGAKLFVGLGICYFFGSLLSIMLLLVLTFAVVIFLFVYSYQQYNKVHPGGR